MTELSPAFSGLLEQARLDLDVSSRELPDLPNKKGKTNWVEKAGGLPDYIDRIAKHIYADTKDASRAIAGAVSQCKKRAAKGNKEAIAAIAQWEAMKAKSKAMNASAPVGILPGETPLDGAGYLLALSAARLDLSVITFDPQAHPRDYKGQFKKAVAALKANESVKLPDGVKVRRMHGSEGALEVSDANGYGFEGNRVQGPTASGEAANMALKRSTSAGKRGELPNDLVPSHRSHPGGKLSGSMDHKDYLDGLSSEQRAEVEALGEHGKQRYGALRQRMPSNYTVATAHKTAHRGAKEHDDFAKKHPFPGDKAKMKAGPSDEEQFGAVTKAIDRMVEGEGEDGAFTGAADEIREVYRAVQGGPGQDLDWEAETILQEIADATERSKDVKDQALNAWASDKLKAYPDE